MKQLGVGSVKIAGGYLVSTVVASVVAAGMLSVGEHNALQLFIATATFGFIYIVTSAWPGFLLTVAAGRWFRLTSPIYFGAAGGTNALLSWFLLHAITNAKVPPGNQLMWACIAGGVAGGVAYWAVQRASPNSLRRQGPAISGSKLPGLGGQNFQGER